MTLAELILHPRTRRALGDYLSRPTHALLLSGEAGVGLGTTARTVAAQLAGTNLVVVRPRQHDKQKTPNINIDDIRELSQFTRDRRSEALVVVIDEAEQLTAAAPEAFLKALEEPAPQVFYILTTHAPAQLPATIKSRAQTIELLPPPSALCAPLLVKCNSQKKKQIEFMAGRRPAEIVRLTSDQDYFKAAAAAMETAKNFVQGRPAERLSIIADTTTRTAAIELARNVARLLGLAARRAQNPKLLVGGLAVAAAVIDNLHRNGHVRAQLLYLALNI